MAFFELYWLCVCSSICTVK